jgi:DNA-binding CsgD family transcriptional regulator
MTKHRTRWSEAEIATLRRMTLDGRSYAEIADALGRTDHAVNIMAYKLNVRHPKIKTWTAAELAKAKRLYDAGNTVQEIARILQRTATGVSSTMTDHGLLDRSRQGCGKRKSDPQVYVLKRRGLMLREILLVLGRDDSERSRKALRGWLEAYCARLGVEVPPASTPRKKPDMALVAAVRAEIASLTGGMSKFLGAQARTEAFNEYIAKRGAA